MKSHLFIAVLAVFVLFSVPNLVSGQPPPAGAACRISCTVAEIMEWSEAAFTPIELDTITPQNSQVTGSSSLTIYTNGNVEITAENSDAAQLSKDPLHKLITEYKLEYDSLGAEQTGGTTTVWRDYGTFLAKGSEVTHISGDGAVEVTLSVRALLESIRPEDSGEYNATQTLTVCWKS